MGKEHSSKDSPGTDFEALDRIQEAEAKAQLIIQEALEKKQKMLEKAKKDSIDLIENAEKEAYLEREELILAVKKDIEKEKQKRSAQNEKILSEVRSSAMLKIKSEADFLFKKFVSEAL